MKKGGVIFFLVLIVIVLALIALTKEPASPPVVLDPETQQSGTVDNSSDGTSSETTTTTTTTTTTSTTTTTTAAKENTLSVNVEGTTEKVAATEYVSERFGYKMLYPHERMAQRNSNGYDYFIWEALGTDVYMAIYKSSEPADSKGQAIRSEMADYFENVSKDSMKIDGASATLYYCTGSYGGSYDENTVMRYCIIPVKGGCLVVEMQLTTESMEGVGQYMQAMLKSMELN